MPQFTTTRRVQHSAASMFDLVADIERYPEFVPLCSSLKVRRRIEEPEGVEILVADMTVAYKVVHESFVSRSRSTGRTCRFWLSIWRDPSATWKIAGRSIRRASASA